MVQLRSRVHEFNLLVYCTWEISGTYNALLTIRCSAHHSRSHQLYGMPTSATIMHHRHTQPQACLRHICHSYHLRVTSTSQYRLKKFSSASIASTMADQVLSKDTYQSCSDTVKLCHPQTPPHHQVSSVHASNSSSIATFKTCQVPARWQTSLATPISSEEIIRHVQLQTHCSE